MFFIQDAGTISSEKLEDGMEELFGAVVMVEIRPKRNYCFSSRTAKITVMSSSDELQKFIRSIDRNGSDTFVINKVVYKVIRDKVL